MGRNPLYFQGEGNEGILHIFNGNKSLIFLMGSNASYFQWEQIRNILITFTMGRNPKYFQREEILNILKGKQSLIFSIGKILNIFNRNGGKSGWQSDALLQVI